MKKYCYVLNILVVGLCVSQIISSIHVYSSNLELYQTLLQIKNHGYIIIPNQHIMDGLKEFYIAFLGGLFFTFSIGAGISIVTFAGIWIWDRLFLRNRIFLIFCLLVWVFCVVQVNFNGFSVLITCYFFFIPVAVCTASFKLMPRLIEKNSKLEITNHLAVILILVFLWGSQINSTFFTDFRDHILLSNYSGIKLNDFYYKYSLYPAQVFKSLNQKTLKTCSIQGVEKKSIKISLQKRLLNYDYLHVGKESNVDLKIKKEKNSLLFLHKNRTVCMSGVENFLTNTQKILNDFSDKTDKSACFRKYTYFSLLIAPFLTLYIFMYAILSSIIFSFISQKNTTQYALILCCLIGAVFAGIFCYTRDVNFDKNNIANELNSEKWQIRARTLEYIRREKLEIGDFPVYKKLVSNSNIVEKCRLARVLGLSRMDVTYKDLLSLLNNSNHNVVWTTLGALGARGDKRAVNTIINFIQKSDHWYEQLQAYKALRRLGWKQAIIPKLTNHS